MIKDDPQGSAPRNGFNQSRWIWFIVAGCVLVVLIALLSPRQRGTPGTNHVSAPGPGQIAPADLAETGRTRERRRHPPSATALSHTAEEIVASKVSQFARNRREVMHAMARRFKVEVPADVEKFFDAVEAGRWEEVDVLVKSLRE